ncbi:hypothetical protein FRB95_001208 [Tulasnella sp. JGI-2019a]|nr:hypothetical protein FRB95_001208 [Tulasnella sp. JGI-2019a]
MDGPSPPGAFRDSPSLGNNLGSTLWPETNLDEGYIASLANSWNPPRYSPSSGLLSSPVTFSNPCPLSSGLEAGTGTVNDYVVADGAAMEEVSGDDADPESLTTSSHPRGGSTFTNTPPVIDFVQHMYDIVEDEGTDHLIKRTSDGKHFVVLDEQGLMKIAGFKTKKFTSLQKQLNNHGFRKKKKSPQKTAKGELANGAWYHDRFLSGRPDLLWEVGRKEPTTASPSPNSAIPHQKDDVAGCGCKSEIARLTSDLARLTELVNSLFALFWNRQASDALNGGHPRTQANEGSQLVVQSGNQSVQLSLNNEWLPAPPNVWPQDTPMEAQQNGSRSEKTPSIPILSTNDDSYHPTGDSQNSHCDSAGNQAATLLQYPAHNFPIAPCVEVALQTPYIPSPIDTRPLNKKKRRVGSGPGSNSFTTSQDHYTRSNRAGPSAASQPPRLAPEPPPSHIGRTNDQIALPSTPYNDPGGFVDRNPPTLNQPSSHPPFSSRRIDHRAKPMDQVPLPGRPLFWDGGGGSGSQ